MRLCHLLVMWLRAINYLIETIKKLIELLLFDTKITCILFIELRSFFFFYYREPNFKWCRIISSDFPIVLEVAGWNRLRHCHHPNCPPKRWLRLRFLCHQPILLRNWNNRNSWISFESKNLTFATQRVQMLKNLLDIWCTMNCE